MQAARPVSAGDDIGPKCFGLMPGFLQPRLDDIADRHQAQKLATAHYRQMAEAAASHGLHHLVDRIVGIAGHDVLGHDLPGFQFQRLGAVAGQRLDEIALGHDSRDGASPSSTSTEPMRRMLNSCDTWATEAPGATVNTVPPF